MKRLYYITLLVLLSFFLWWVVAYVISGDGAAFVGIAAFILDVLAFVLMLNDNEH